VVQSRAAAACKVFGKMLGAMEYLTRMLSSKVCDIAIESSLLLTTKLSDSLGVNLWLKHDGQVLDKILFFHPADCPILLRLCLNVQNTTGVPHAELQKELRIWAVSSIPVFQKQHFFGVLLNILL
jgi:hypothetical protein